jgi:EmrB/QacA subfamily drug resistance transporter
MMGSITIAVPTMMTSLRVEVTEIQWVLTSFMIARTVVMPTLGWLGGLLGNRRLYLTSLSVYVVASMLCGLSWNLLSLLLFRVVQGMSAGYLTPLGMAILHETYPAGKRGMAMGVFMAGMSFGPAIGPSLGGYLVAHLSWRAVFYINLPIGLLALLGAMVVILPEGERRQSTHLDLPGMVTMTTCIVSLLLAVSQVRLYGWGSAYILTLLSLAGATLLGFLGVELTCPAPLVNLQVFANGQFVLGALANFCESFSTFAMNFMMALFLQQALGFNAAQAGEMMLPAACIWGLTSLYTGRLADRIESRWLILAGSLTQSLGLCLFLRVTPASSPWTIAALLILRSLARGFIQSPIMTVTMATLPDHQVRLGVGLRGLLNSLGGTFGIACAGIVLQQRLVARTHAQLGPGQGATTLAYHDMFLLTAALVCLTALPVLWLRQRRVVSL